MIDKCLQLREKTKSIECGDFDDLFHRNTFGFGNIVCTNGDILWFISHLGLTWDWWENMLTMQTKAMISIQPFKIKQTWEIYREMYTEIEQNKNTTCFSGPRAGESVSRHIFSSGNCFTSFCFLAEKEKHMTSQMAWYYIADSLKHMQELLNEFSIVSNCLESFCTKTITCSLLTIDGGIEKK